jgi:hypothetical protein
MQAWLAGNCSKISPGTTSDNMQTPRQKRSNFVLFLIEELY